MTNDIARSCASATGEPIEAAAHRAKIRWPGIECAEGVWVAHTQRLSISAEDLRRFGDELYLVCACLEGDQLAALVLERQYVIPTARVLARLGERDFIDEASQLLRERVLMPPERRLEKYAAKGPLLAWLGRVACRIGLDLRRRRKQTFEELTPEHLVQEPSEEISDLPRYRQIVDAAVRRAVDQLADRDRALLRLRYLGELDIDQLGDLYGVHRATAARWLAHAKDRMRDGIQQEACPALGMSPNELYRLFVQTQDQLELNLDTLFEPC
ncbi:MAG TPA: sigma factor-like helix-turn-helix DNA-binding protein [Polyangiaceae bacterium]|nr:sigma factor-like helix-turn-helix DNA-binding protein [Polyangiaceae bacterium]